MRILSRRAAIVLLLISLFLCGIALFVGTYIRNASKWVQYPANRHLYTNGQPNVGTIFDRNGVVLAQTVNGVRKYNSNATIRTAVMQTLGDSNGDVATGVQVAFSNKLGGWSLLNGTYRFGGTVSNIQLTLDTKLCATAYNALAGRSGTVGVYNYKTGEILCMVSSPSFDPQSPPNVKANTEKYKGVYMNRLLSATYTPGSVFKLVTLAAAIDTLPGITNKTFYCNGVLNAAGGKVTCPEAHGRVTLSQALSDSCNVTFGGLALQLGASILSDYAKKAGFNESLDINGIKTAPGKVDLSNAKGANLAWAGIGQYTDTANPLTYMAYVGAIANGGVRVAPRLLKNSVSAQTHIITTSTAATIGQMMRYDTLNNYSDWNYPGLMLCAKSGTAQLSMGEAPDAWFVGYMNRADCPLAFVVVIENGGSGSKVAGPVADIVLQAAVKTLTGK